MWLISRLAICLGALILAVTGCRQDMHDQPRYKPLASSESFADGRASRPPVAGTVARGELREDPLLYTGRTDGRFSRSFPFPMTHELMKRGRERYDIFCAPCHDRLGTGRGMVVRRGLSQPPSFHIDRLRAVENGYLFDVITNGFGRMSSHAAQVPVADRWAIVAYMRALQRSQHAPLTDVPPAERGRLDDRVVGR
jgi:cbb3-type cytochrome c oxidase subunit III